MEDPESPKPPEPRTRRACQAHKEAKKLEEQRLQEECPYVMMVGENEEVRQRTADKEHDEGRRQLDALMRGEGDVGEIKKEVMDEEEEELEKGSQELDAAQSDEVGKENGDVTIKEEVSEGEEEGLLEVNTVGNNLLLGGINVAIDMDLLRDLELKEENIGAGNLAVGRDEEWGAEQEVIILDEEEGEVVPEDEVEGEEIADQVVNGGEAEGEGHDEVLRPEEVVKPGHGEDMNMEEDIAALWLSEMGNGKDQSFVEDEEGHEAVNLASGGEAKQDGANCSGEVVDAGHGGEGEVNVELEENIAVGKDEIERISADQSLVEDVEDQAAVVEKVLLFGLWV